MRKYSKPKVVFTGLGPICSLGIGKIPLWKNLLRGNTNIVKDSFKAQEEIVHSYYVHKMQNFKLTDFGIPFEKIDAIDQWKNGDKVRDLELFLLSIKLAIDDSDFKYHTESNNIGLVLAAESPGHGEFFLKFIKHSLASKNYKISNHEAYLDFYKNFKSTGYDLQSFMTLFHIAKLFDFHGCSVFLNNACASGLYAIDYASALIETGRCDVVVVAAVDSPNIFKSFWFNELGVSPEDGLIKPFDKNGNGFILGEGGAAVVLENKKCAVARGAHMYGEYLGGGFNQEGWKVSFPRIKDDYYKRAISRSLTRSRIKASDIDLIVPHGVGSKIYDSYEIESLCQVFPDVKNRPQITALKPYFGHLLGGSTMIETAVLLLMLENQIILPTLNSFSISSGIESMICLNMKKNCGLNNVLKTCTAFAGFNSSIVIQKIANY